MSILSLENFKDDDSDEYRGKIQLIQDHHQKV